MQEKTKVKEEKNVLLKEKQNERIPRNKVKTKNGITLIALVITIIVLLILAGVSIAMLTGQNGILTQAQKAKSETERAEIIEKAKLEILNVQAESREEELTEEKLTEILTSEEYGIQGTLSDNGESSILDKTFTTQDGKYQIQVKEIYDGKIKEKEKIIFTIDGIQFEAEEGATWGNWITENKEVLIENNFEDLAEIPVWDNYIGKYLGGGNCYPRLQLNGKYVIGDDMKSPTEAKIINGGNYTWRN